MIANKKRPGLMLVDAAFGLLLLGVAGLLITNMLGTVARSRRATDIRQAALQCAANEMERLVILPWDKLTPGERELEPPTELSAVLPGASLWVSVTDMPDDSLGLRRLEVEVRWPTTNQPHRPVKLATWVGPHGRPRS